MTGIAHHLFGHIDAVFLQLYYTEIMLHKVGVAQLHATFLASAFKPGLPWILTLSIIFSIIWYARQLIISSRNNTVNLALPMTFTTKLLLLTRK